jgi:ABC-type multidrug transport system fused ATPase/permease subunit
MSTTHERFSFRVFLARVERVARLFGQMARDGTSDGRLRVLLVTAMSFLGATAQAGTIAALNFFVKAIEAEVPKVVPYLGFPIQSDVRTLLLLTGVILSLQMLNALAIYYVAITSRAIGRAFHERSAEKIFEAFSRAPYVRPGLADARSELRASVTRYPRIMGMAIEQMVGTLQGACYVVGFLVVLFTISVEVSLFTLPVFLLVLPFFYRLSMQTQKAAKSFYGQVRQQANHYARDQLEASDQTNVHPALYGATQIQQYRASEFVQDYLDTYDQIRLAQRRSILITSLFRGFLLCLILAVLGTFSVRGSYSWGQLLVYVLALWQLANYVQGMMASLVNLNRYQPRVVNYYAVQAMLVEKAAAHPAAASFEGPLVIASRESLEGSAGRLEVTRGDRIVYLTDASLSRMEFASVLAPLLAACSGQKRILRAASFCSGADTAPRLSLSSMVLGSEAPGGDERADLEVRIAELGLARELASLPEGSDTFLSDETWATMDQKLRVALRILSLAESSSDVLFLDWGLIASAEKDFVTRLLGILADRIVFLVSPDGMTECAWARGFVVSENEEIVGVGDARWWGAILPYRRERVASRKAQPGLEDERDDDEEDM